jgi:hypothetical protein
MDHKWGPWWDDPGSLGTQFFSHGGNYDKINWMSDPDWSSCWEGNMESGNIGCGRGLQKHFIFKNRMLQEYNRLMSAMFAAKEHLELNFKNQLWVQVCQFCPSKIHMRNNDDKYVERIVNPDSELNAPLHNTYGPLWLLGPALNYDFCGTDFAHIYCGLHCFSYSSGLPAEQYTWVNEFTAGRNTKGTSRCWFPRFTGQMLEAYPENSKFYGACPHEGLIPNKFVLPFGDRDGGYMNGNLVGEMVREQSELLLKTNGKASLLKRYHKRFAKYTTSIRPYAQFADLEKIIDNNFGIPRKTTLPPRMSDRSGQDWVGYNGLTTLQMAEFMRKGGTHRGETYEISPYPLGHPKCEPVNGHNLAFTYPPGWRYDDLDECARLGVFPYAERLSERIETMYKFITSIEDKAASVFEDIIRWCGLSDYGFTIDGDSSSVSAGSIVDYAITRFELVSRNIVAPDWDTRGGAREGDQERLYPNRLKTSDDG